VKAQIHSLRDGDPKKFQGWTLKGLVGEGGQSTIYLAEKNGQNAALKIIRKEQLHNAKSVERFSTEIKNLEMLDHPNIAHVLEVENSGQFVAIEFIDGPNLEDYVSQSSPLPYKDWCVFALQLANAIEYCHSRGIIHKDVSPRNILFGAKGPVLIDFGISYLETDPRLTSDGETIGTPPFMSPEHFGISTPKEMDTFSLAGTLVYAATGHYPFSGETKSEWRESILFNFPDFSGLSEDQIKLLSPLLYKKPEHRGTLATFSKILSELIASETRSDFVLNEFAKANRESQNKLVQEKKKLKVRNQSIKKVVASAAVISLVSVGAVAYGIVAIQDNSFEDSAQLSSPMGFNSALTADQLMKASACKDLASFEDYKAALVACQETAQLGDAWSQYSLGLSLEKSGKIAEGESWVLAAAEQKLPDAMALMASYEINRMNYSKALSWAKQSANTGNLVGVEAVGITYAYLKQFDSAVEWYKKSWDLGDIQGARNLGYHYWFEDFNKDQASKWLKVAAEANSSVEGATAYDYAEFLRQEIKNTSESCKWYKKSSELNFKEDEKDGVLAFRQNCLNESAKPATSTTPKKSTPNLLDPSKPITSSDSFKVSAPTAPGVQVDEIFGRAFINSLNYWVIPLTNTKDAKVPALTSIQFRMIGYPNADWMDVPYKLKTDKLLGSVYAEVDDMLFAVIFKQLKYCPEFRVVREMGGRIVQIWEKGQPECSTDYNP
jgi:serine/threonine protein kinase